MIIWLWWPFGNRKEPSSNPIQFHQSCFTMTSASTYANKATIFNQFFYSVLATSCTALRQASDTLDPSVKSFITIPHNAFNTLLQELVVLDLEP